MKGVSRSTTLAIVALLLPGLALAAPIAGACGRCGDGDGCHLQQPEEPSPETQSCCDSETKTPPEPSFGSSNCECGRQAPPALAAASPTKVETASLVESIQEKINPITPVTTVFSYSARPPAPPPAPPAYLIDCSFLT